MTTGEVMRARDIRLFPVNGIARGHNVFLQGHIIALT